MGNNIEKRVVGFQHWVNGHEDGYGSVHRMYGVESMSVSECEDEGQFEGAGMTYVYSTEE